MNAISKTITGGIVATIAMTVLMTAAPMMGLPKMNAAAMLGSMLGGSLILGWMMHFGIGIFFALAYFFFVNARLTITSNLLRGSLYGFFVFVFAQIMMAGMGLAGLLTAAPAGSMALMIAGSLMGHLIYGIVLGAFVARKSQESKARLA